MSTFNFLGKALTVVGDIDVVQDMYTKHNKNIDKTDFSAEFFKPMVEDIFSVMPANETWKL